MTTEETVSVARGGRSTILSRDNAPANSPINAKGRFSRTQGIVYRPFVRAPSLQNLKRFSSARAVVSAKFPWRFNLGARPLDL
jgi:hypothetical protein